MRLSKMILGRLGTRHLVRSPWVEEKKHHTFISGTGWSGTTFLIKLLTNLDLDTGDRPDSRPGFVPLISR